MIGRLLRRMLWLGATLLALTIGAVMYFSAANLSRYGAGQSPETPMDALLVLGGGVDGDGLIGFSSRRRVRVAVALLKAGKAERLIFSGGNMVRYSDQRVAELMRDFALGIGAPPERVLLEIDSASTFGNLRLGFALAEAQGLRRVAIVTDAFHVERTRHLTAYFGRPEAEFIAVAGLDRDSLGNRVWAILREALAWWLNLAKVAGWEVLGLAGVDSAERTELIR